MLVEQLSHNTEVVVTPTNLSQTLELREAIFKFEEAMGELPGVVYGDNDFLPLKHSFADGMYIRQIFLPAGTLVTGAIHKHCHPAFLLSGDVSVITEHTGLERIKGPANMISKPGTKRLIYVHEDATWVTVHLNPSETRDIEQLKDEIIAKTYDELPPDTGRTII